MFFRKTRTPGMTPAEAVAGAKTGNVIVIDVRDQGEVALSGKAKGALHLPLMRLQDLADPRHPDFCGKLTPDCKIACYCASGGRSGRAVQILERLGYSNVSNIGGLGHWVRAGGQVERI
ncbi:rhodanese-like domain-containing protein [Pseudodonghicola xiamenensis]|uniref:Rhodanese-like domain-containing protein n=1 Tax=Pseudodonghicola xiamenensis TaxID=337702 RepID=A0A8J3MC50_9RHOB|nr:rhodanese-like domain-containing protein [Pseudodonghicola xiamenensis]GHG87485.1 rhodanese-like domain-containing protein [Pseudodonghicola xiamenensis]